MRWNPSWGVLAEQYHFTAWGLFLPSRLEVRDEVREMCGSNRCGGYGQHWTCPPYCGSLEQCRQTLGRYQSGCLVCTTVTLEDPFDYPGMKLGEQRHKQNFYALARQLHREGGRVLALGTGPCCLCDPCPCPQLPCPHPEEAISSMEAYGLVVGDVCRLAGMPYYCGPDTISYFSCYLYHEKQEERQ